MFSKKNIKIIISLLILGCVFIPGKSASAEVLNSGTSVQAIKVGWTGIDGKWYYYKNNEMAKGWQQVGPTWYYMDASGVMKTGWQQIDSKWYYMDASGGMKTGWQQIDSTWYYMDASGVMKTGWQQIDSTWYYMDASGVMKTGWQQIDSKWYYMDASGVMKTGWQQVDSKWYYMDASGVMATNTTIEGYTIGSDGAIVANKGQQLVDEAKAHLPLVTYVYGANNEASHIFDCSSFTKHIFGHRGISLGRTTWDQMNQGSVVSRADLKAGDLVFTIGGNHVGIYTSNGQMIHNSREGVNVIEGPIYDFYTARRVQ
ncbi:NlpC/P60 family protein [Clostridium gasigenes]|uniref:NlpC/P60 family protein n=1 Tax=Clostridium gasigenes TaxID=94869 RepID=UPI00209B6878|nr:NlpC/P60 family protein [Clostridium gasigenes]